MNGWDFDWLSALLGAVGGAILAFVAGFSSKAGERAFDKMEKRVSPTPEGPKQPIVVRSDFLDAPETIKALSEKYHREKYKQELLHPSDRSKHEAEGWLLR